MSHGAMSADEDDWETADLSSIKPPTTKDKAGSLRPSAPLFQPRATDASTTATTAAAAAAKPAEPTRKDAAAKGVPAVKLLSRASASSGTLPGSGGMMGASSRLRDTAGDDEWFGSRGAVSNRQIWESANAPSAAPPTILAPTAHPLPQPSIQILRRDQSAPGKAAKPSGNAPVASKTMEEREEQYRIARERIFGTSESPAATPSSASGAGAASMTAGSRSSSPKPGNSGRQPSDQQAGSDPSSRTSSGKGRKRRPAKKDGLNNQQQQSGSPPVLFPYDGYAYSPMPSSSAAFNPVGPMPHQVRQSPAPGSLRTGPTQGIIRQPRGAEAGPGFGFATAQTIVSEDTRAQQYNGPELDERMAHWMSQASFGSTPRHSPQPY